MAATAVEDSIRREVVGGGGPHEHARWRAARGEARAPMSRRRADAQAKTNRRRREEEEEKGRLFDEEEEEGIDLR